MGISTDAMFIVGLEGKELAQCLDRTDDNEADDYIVNLVEEHDLDYASPEYDDPPFRWIVGYSVTRKLKNFSESSAPDMAAKIMELQADFYQLTGLPAKMFVTTDIS